MNSFVPGIPAASEYNAAYGVYIGKAEKFAAPIDRLDEQLSEVLSLLEPLNEAQQLHRYAPGKWSVKEMLGHIIDGERVFSYRALRIGRGDTTPLPGFEQDGYVTLAESDRVEWSELLEEFEHVRRSTILMLRHFPPTAWVRMGTSSDISVSVRAMVYVIIGHVEHHLGILKERYSL